MRKHLTRGLIAAALLSASSTAYAQQAPDHRWSVDFGIGWDRTISGNINSGAIGTLNGQAAVILRNKYDDVYGTGLHVRFGAGYLLQEESELRVAFTIQSLDADLTRMGDLGVSNLYAQYDDYQAFALDFGYRRYLPFKHTIRGYGEALIGVAVIDETHVVLAAPSVNFIGTSTDFYDKTAAFTLSGNVGVAFAVRENTDAFAQVGLRYTTGMSAVDNLNGTGLDTINDHSARWAVPFSIGVRLRF